MLPYSFQFFICVFITLDSSTIGIKIEFSKDNNFKDVTIKTNSAEKCNDLPVKWERIQGRSGYIRTDTCTIVYTYYGCAHYDSIKILPGQTIKYPWYSGSYHTCNEEYGSMELNIDITKFNEFSPESTYLKSIPLFSTFSSRQHITPPETLAQYLDLCSCVNIPNTVLAIGTWSINNHGNELLAYYNPNCNEIKLEPKLIRAGYSKITREIFTLEKTDRSTNVKHKIQSFGPHFNSTYFRTNCRYTVITDLELYETNTNTSKQDSLLLETQQGFETKINVRTKNAFEQQNRRTRFFSSPNFQDFLFDGDMSTECITFQKSTNRRWVTNEIGSIKTGACVILYSDHKCVGRSIKVLPPGSHNLTKNWEQTVTGPKTLTLLYNFLQGSKWTTKSFRFCDDEYGGNELNVVFTQYHPDVLSLLDTEVYESHKNICFCKNIPKYIHDLNNWSMNNYGNSLMGYFDQNCLTARFSPLWIPAGRSSFSIGLGLFQKRDISNGTIYKIRSIGPDPKADYFKTNCAKLYFTIKKCVVIVSNRTKSGLSNYVEETLEMRAPIKTFQNNEFESKSYKFSAHMQIPEVVRLEIGISFKDIFGVDVSSSFTVEARNNEQKFRKNLTEKFKQQTHLDPNTFGNTSRLYVFFEEPSLTGGLIEAYENLETLETATTTIRSTRIFTVDEAVNVSPCTELRVNGYLKTLKNNQVQVFTLGQMRGLLGDQEMTAGELHRYIDKQHDYVGEFDNNSIWAYSTQNIVADYGVSTFVNSTSIYLYDCLAEKILISLVESFYG